MYIGTCILIDNFQNIILFFHRKSSIGNNGGYITLKYIMNYIDKLVSAIYA